MNHVSMKNSKGAYARRNRVFIGAWVTNPVAAAVADAVRIRGYRNRAEFLRVVLRAVVDDHFEEARPSRRR